MFLFYLNPVLEDLYRKVLRFTQRKFTDDLSAAHPNDICIFSRDGICFYSTAHRIFNDRYIIIFCDAAQRDVHFGFRAIN